MAKITFKIETEVGEKSCFPNFEISQEVAGYGDFADYVHLFKVFLLGLTFPAEMVENVIHEKTSDEEFDAELTEYDDIFRGTSNDETTH